MDKCPRNLVHEKCGLTAWWAERLLRCVIQIGRSVCGSTAGVRRVMISNVLEGFVGAWLAAREQGDNMKVAYVQDMNGTTCRSRGYPKIRG